MDLEIYFEPNWNAVAISLSGGADSALLAYLICDKIWKSNSEHVVIHVISHTRCWKTKPWQQYDSLKVYNWLLQHFSKLKFQRHVNFVPPDLEWADRGPNIIDEQGRLVSGDNIELRSFAEYICYHNKIDAYYNGVTRNPRNVDFKGMPTRDIEPTEDNTSLSKTRHMEKWSLHPFRFIEKKDIIKKYYELGLEDLLNITRSCEGTVPNLDYKNYKPYQYVPVCGECFWCKEREWAIEQSK